MSNSNRDTGTFLTAFFMGAMAGGAAALFLAPQSGEETREQIRQKSVEMRGRAEEALAEARAKAEAAAADVKRRAEELQAQSQVILEEGQVQLAQAVDLTKEAAAEAGREA